MSKSLKGAFMCAALMLSQTVCLADEIESSTVQVNTPVSESTTSVKTKVNGSGKSTVVRKDKTRVAGGAKSTTYRAKAGPGGAKVSKTDRDVQVNGDGSVTENKSHESHEVNAAGAVHHKSDSSQTTDIDGSSTSVKTESTKKD